MSHLVVLNGAPGVGKSTVARLLFERLDDAAWLDADDVWRIRPFRVDERTRPIVEANVSFVVRGYLEARYRFVLLSWVLHRRDLLERILAGVAITPEQLSMVTLTCDEAILRERIGGDPGRETEVPLALERLRQTRALGTTCVDTSTRSPESVADGLAAILMAR